MDSFFYNHLTTERADDPMIRRRDLIGLFSAPHRIASSLKAIRSFEMVIIIIQSCTNLHLFDFRSVCKVIKL